MNNGEWTCPLCGATLDAGEKCDCQDEKSPATKGETKQSSISITQAGGFGKYD